MAMLEVSGLTKEYRKNGGILLAVSDVSFTVNSGEVVGFIGPNGAGKSTAIKIITGLATATQGTVQINGLDNVKNRAQAIANVGAIIENPDMYINWTAEENLKYFLGLSIAKYPNAQERVDELLKTVNLYERRKDKVRKFSLGMKQRLGIAQALLNEPKLLILDEPANGLDPNGIKEMREIITRLAHVENMAVLVSSHQLAEMQLTCDRFVIINNGKIIATPTREELNGCGNGNTVLIGTDDVVKARDVIKEKFKVDAVMRDGCVEVNIDMSINDITRELILDGVNITGIKQKAVSLEEYFMSLTNKEAK